MSDLSYYADKTNFLYGVYACDLKVEEHLANLFFNDDLNRIIYSSNAYAFRKRSNQNAGNLSLPFLNYRLTSYERGARFRWNATSYTEGVYIDELQLKIKYAPILLTYECSVWYNRDDELKYAIAQANFDADIKTNITPTVLIDSTEMPFNALWSYSNNTYEPEYNEKDWLEKNRIHSAKLDFTLDTFSMEVNRGIVLPTTAVLNFASSHEGYDGNSFEEAHNFLIDHVNETVTEE